MKIVSKNSVVTWIALGATMFMAAVCFYLIIGALISSKIYPVFYYYVPFSFLVHGMVMSMAASGVWLVLFGNKKLMHFMIRFIIAMVIITAFYLISDQIPAINSLVGHLRWIWSCCVAILVLGVPFSIVKEKRSSAGAKALDENEVD